MESLKTPLHHCYLVPAVSVGDCIAELKAAVLGSVGEDGLTFDIDTVEFLDIEMARDMRALGLQQAAGETRCIVRGFDTIGDEAQNALLKILEDPARGTHFFLVTPNSDQLLETVRSRVWELSGLCSGADESELGEWVDELLAAQDLPAALAVAEKLETRTQMRTFIKLLAGRSELRESARQPLAQAVEDAASWSRDSGASVKLLRQFLAIASQQSKSAT